MKTTKYILFLFFILLPITGFSGSLEEYWKECEKCENGLISIKSAIEKYRKDSNTTGFEIRSEEDFHNFEKIAYERHYTQEPILGAKGECSYRYNPNDAEPHCIKHGSLEYVKDYSYYKNAKEKQNKENLIFSLIGVGIIIFAIIF